MHQFPKEAEAERRRQERLKELSTVGNKLPIEYRFLTIEEIGQEEPLFEGRDIIYLGNRPELIKDLDVFKALEKVMRPGAQSEAGFLDPTERLYEVYQNDDATLKKLGISYDQIADKLEEIVKACQDKKYAEQVKIKSMTVTLEVCFGHEDCPFGCPAELKSIGRSSSDPIFQKVRSSIDYTVTDNNSQLFFSGLHVHLIRDHHFFEGHTKYRLDPEYCVNFFGLMP
jgi:hypothetical protein